MVVFHGEENKSMEEIDTHELLGTIPDGHIGEILKLSLQGACVDAHIEFTPQTYEALEKHVQEMSHQHPDVLLVVQQERIKAQELAADIPLLERSLKKLEEQYALSKATTQVERQENKDEDPFAALGTAEEIQHTVQRMLQEVVELNVASVAAERHLRHAL